MAKRIEDLVAQLPEEVRTWFNSIHGGSERYHFERILRDIGPANFEKHWKDHKEEYELYRNGRFVHVSPSLHYIQKRRKSS